MLGVNWAVQNGFPIGGGQQPPLVYNPGPPAIPSYLGFVATRCGLHPYNVFASAAMSRSTHFARDNITSASLIFAACYGTAEAPSYAATVTAAIEYPAGTITQITFNGAAQGKIPQGSYVVSDLTPLKVTIPVGAQFWVRSYYYNGTQLPMIVSRYPDLSESCCFGNSINVTDQTMGGTIIDSGNNAGGFGTSSVGLIHRPVAILGMTSRPSFLLNGQFHPDVEDFNGDLGMLARSVGGYGYSSAMMPSAKMTDFTSHGTVRTALMKYCSHSVMDLGNADIMAQMGTTSNNQMSYNLATSLQSIFGVAVNNNTTIYFTTQPPYTNSTDNWATTTHQTAANTTNNSFSFGTGSARAEFNDFIRGGFANSMFDVAASFESSTDSGIWNANGTAGAYTLDGLNPSPAAQALIASTNVINPYFVGVPINQQVKSSVILSDALCDSPGTSITSHQGNYNASWALHPLYSSGGYQLQWAAYSYMYPTGNTVVLASGPSDLTTTKNIDITATMMCVSVQTQNPGIVFYASSTNDTYYVLRYSQASGNWQFYAKVNGVFSAVGSAYADSSFNTANAMRYLKISVRTTGTVNTMSLYLNGTIVIPPTNDSSIAPGGKIGLRDTNSAPQGNGFSTSFLVATNAGSLGQAVVTPPPPTSSGGYSPLIAALGLGFAGAF